MWELDHKEVWAPKNWCFWTVVLEKTFESPFDGKEIKPVNPKGNERWRLIGRTDAEAESLFGYLMQNANSLGKTLMLGKVESMRIRGQQKMKWLDGIIVSWTWVYANSWRLWRTGKPGTLQSMELHTDEWLNDNQMWREDRKLKFLHS